MSSIGAWRAPVAVDVHCMQDTWTALAYACSQGHTGDVARLLAAPGIGVNACGRVVSASLACS
jgi:hypothetical protein